MPEILARDELIVAALDAIRVELEHQVAKHGGDANIKSSTQWMSLISEEVGESAALANRLEWDIQRFDEAIKNVQAMRVELIQIAALCVSAYVWTREGSSV